MGYVGDKVTYNEAVNKGLKCVLHEGRRIKMATVAYSIFWSENKVRNPWSHEAVEGEESGKRKMRGNLTMCPLGVKLLLQGHKSIRQ
jgi:hypothetical protein